MKYNPTATPIPKNRRDDINKKILDMLSSTLPESITPEDIFNGYTGVGGLHGLDRNSFPNYFEYAEEKKEIEQGQFFTPADMVEQICSILPITSGDVIADITCGAGAFFNSLPESQCYGIDIDSKAIKVAKFLYPEANIECRDIRTWEPDTHFDYIVGNPPFNLKWEIQGLPYLSQYYYCLKASMIMKPGGILIFIAPDSFLKDEFFTKSMIEEINSKFNFLFQISLPKNGFANMGVTSFNTKVMCFQAHADSIEQVPYSSTYLSDWNEADQIMQTVGQQRNQLKLKLYQETLKKFGNDFNYKSKKYLYEIKAHKILKPYYSHALSLIDKLNNQKCPANMSYEEWDKSKLTNGRVLALLRAIVARQVKKDVHVFKPVKSKYNIRYKPYSRKALNMLKAAHPTHSWSIVDLVTGNTRVPAHIPKGFKKLIRKKQSEYLNQCASWKTLERIPEIDAYLKKFAWYNPAMQKCKFNEMQLADLGLILQKKYAILNWQMGTGKTSAIAAWARYKEQSNTFIVSAALAINMTWEPFMRRHNKKYIIPKTISDIENLQKGTYVLLTLDYLIKLRRHIKKYVKMISYNINFVFDESDEITNPGAKRTQAVLDCFRKAKRKLLATGTTTRNNITELYSQLELLYNNSANLLCFCETYTYEDKEKILQTQINPYYLKPFPAKSGSLWFKRCFNPSKSTVFGIQRHNQNIYNEPQLRKLLEYTVITRKFKEIAGSKYSIISDKVNQNQSERKIYWMIIKELNKILPEYYTSTGNSRKDAMLRVLRQLQLLIKATSTPHLFKEWDNGPIPNKCLQVFKRVEEHNEKIAIGCTSIEAVEWYVKELRERFKERLVFEIKGDVSFKTREKIRKAFESTTNGILVATQQSLKSSVNIPTCSKVIIESKQWNIPKIEQFFFRFIRYDSPNKTEVIFISYENTIEMNLLALLMAKEKLNDYIKTLEYRDDSDVYQEYDINLDILDSIITKEKDEEGTMQIRWGAAELV